jgi:hypothetical protein
MFIQAQSLLLMLLAAAASKPATPGIGKHEVDVIYGRKDGMALTMDVVHPPGKPNGRGIIFVVSGRVDLASQLHRRDHPRLRRQSARPRVHHLRRRTWQPAALHDSGCGRRPPALGPFYPREQQAVGHRSGQARDFWRVGGRTPLAHDRSEPAAGQEGR